MSHEENETMNCPKCGHIWSPRVNQPKRCPRCGKWLDDPTEGGDSKSEQNEIKKVEKRDGRIVNFDQSKITEAIWSAAQSVGGRNKRLAERLSDKVVDYLEENLNKKIPHVEDIQDAVEKVLIEEGHAKTAKAYILYRKQHEDMRKIKTTFLEVEELVDDYLGQRSWRVKENSNVGYSMSGLYKHAAGSVVTNYTLDRVYQMEVSDAHRNGDIHIHDLSFGIAGYCAGWSLSKLLKEGFNGVPGKVESKPPKHYDTALLQMANFIGTLQNEWAGAQAFNSMDTLLAPFVRKDDLSYREVKQGMQKFVFNLNIASRWGGQTPFTNLTLDWTVPNDLKESPVIHAGETKDETYAGYQNEMDLINKALLEVLMEGDKNGRPFTFPIPTYNVTDSFNWDSENAELLFEMTSQYGLPYFSNFVNSPDLNPDDIRSMCCRLRLDERELERNVTGGLFGSSDQTGSLGVVTINMPRIGFLADNESDFFERLDYMMVLAKNSLEVKREVVSKNMQNELLPYSKRYLGHLNNHFSTIGLVGMNEACLNLLGKRITTKEGHDFAIRALEYMRDRLQDFQEKTGNLYNLEATPAEGTSYRLAKDDKQKYPEIITAGEDTPYYTNSTQIPVGYTDDLFKQVEIEEDLQTLYTGGTVFHTFLGEKMTEGEAKTLVKKLTHKSELPYVTLTPTYSICQDHGYMAGEHEACPDCGKKTEVYSRVVGYYRPTQNWNDGKQEEFVERNTFEKTRALQKSSEKA
ncbi:MAG: ribonucleoside triphosphate reductase [Candidatus Hadarchaeia archaeon]